MSVDFFRALSFDEVKAKSDRFLLGNYGRPIARAFSFGQGEYLFDSEGKRYLDFHCGISVTNIGHSDADIVEAIRDQAERLIHSSNLCYSQEQALLAEALVGHSFPSRVFLCNSGTEANEAAFKLARSYGQQARGGATSIVSVENSFHGRTTAGMSMTGQSKIHGGFGPLLSDMVYLRRNDQDLLRKEFDENGSSICAVILELVQGEGGIHVLDREFVRLARELCSEYKALLIVDEIQTGMGRTGKLWGYEHYDIIPDVMSLAKALGSGLPIGALLIGEEFAPYLGKGQHGSTFGGNHLAARAALETLRIIVGRELLENAAGISEYLFRRLRLLRDRFSCIREVRGIGLHIGVELDREGGALVNACLERGLVVNCTAGNVIRIMPPLNLSLDRAAEGMDLFEQGLADFQAQGR
ncbi:MAG: aspartate aminotransferase family protein [Leptospirales bacterium]|nr:aspartate aminotransferase family protein [Leptospirales bacterium]